MPESVEMPAPVSATQVRPRSRSAAAATRSVSDATVTPANLPSDPIPGPLRHFLVLAPGIAGARTRKGRKRSGLADRTAAVQPPGGLGERAGQRRVDGERAGDLVHG